MPADQLRNRTVGCKMTEAEYEQLVAVAQREGLTLGEWCRDVLVERANGRKAQPIEETLLAEVIALRTILFLVQFGAHRDLQGSHIGGHIVYFYNVWEDGDEAMGPVTGLVCRRVSREGSQFAVGGVHRGTAESVGTVAQGASPTHRDRAH